MPRPILPPLDLVTPDTPLRLAAAAAIAFPDGSMSAAILKSEADKGRLAIERIGRRYYTTLRNIEAMREKCRVEPKAPGYGCALPAGTQEAASPIRPHGSSAMPADIAAALNAYRTTSQELKERLQGTSPQSTKRKPAANVLPMKSRSRTCSQSTSGTSR